MGLFLLYDHTTAATEKINIIYVVPVIFKKGIHKQILKFIRFSISNLD